ncbi:hypothetical protein JQ616_29790 [Bradyrhizobium tropiciagri]|uniref:hypothetical protein n=1 Tax=Bradyrhizobium tropiciagri TaxID=312253 RepID=UPI001BAAD758|nr:hypothetical protein [Bradyrhizobium tropiciagri]MBR0899165.1 hypothetical protein [Bradyrhizobium tropiciagri]
MLTAQDDLIGHQTPATFATSGAGDVRFTERYWYTAHPIDGSELLVDIGLGYYPNRHVMDGFAGVTIGRKQHNFRTSRRLGTHPLETSVGGLKIEIIEGMNLHRLTLADNPSGISFSLEFRASFPPAQEKQNYREREGTVEEDLARVSQFGRWRGWIAADGKRFEVTPETWWGQRDRSWGLRSEMRTDETRPPVATHRNFFWTWSMFQFERSALSVFVKERAPGKPHYLSGAEFRREADGSISHREVTTFEHSIEWSDDQLGQTITSADFTFNFDRGEPRYVRMVGLPPRFYLKAGMYGGLKGWTHGDDRGEQHAAYDVWDLDDAATRATARTLSDHVVRLESGSEIGFGISEYGVAVGYPRYQAPQKFPAL